MAITISPAVSHVDIISAGTFIVTGSFFLILSGVSDADPKITYQIDSVTKFISGVDNSTTNDDWVISRGSTLGTNNAISIDGNTGVVSISGIALAGGMSTSVTSADTALITATADLTTNDPVNTLSAPATASDTEPIQ